MVWTILIWATVIYLAAYFLFIFFAIITITILEGGGGFWTAALFIFLETLSKGLTLLIIGMILVIFFRYMRGDVLVYNNLFKALFSG
jgi:hypothetical protein